MRPLIKWAGGKSSEIKYVEKILPKFDRYVEPFFGGGEKVWKKAPKLLNSDCPTKSCG